MASYTDAITQFNPYIAQQPVEAMVKVGMEKQQLYNEGIQKIQAGIDNTAALDIYKDIDKNYLQSKLDELGSNLTKVAGGDFSNFQLVNSVGGMTNQIVKDRKVQNAVGSTAHIRQQYSIIDAAKKKGESGIQNEEWFKNSVGQYVNDPTVGATFNDDYVPYSDVDKKLRDVADKIHMADRTIDIPYKRDNNANVIYYDRNGVASLDPSKGKPKVDDAMLSIITKGKSANKILNNFYESLTPNDIQQLKIDGWYHYKGATKDTFKTDIINTYTTNKKILSDAAVQTALEIQTNSKLSSSEKTKLQAELNDINTKLTDGSLEKDLNNSLGSIDNITDINDYKYRLYTQKHLTNLAKDISDETISTEYKTNPYAQMDMEKKRLNFSYWNANREHEQWRVTHEWDITKWTLEQQQKEEEKRKKTFIVVDPTAIPTTVDIPSISKLDKNIEAILGKRDASGKLIEAGQMDELNTRYASDIPGGDKMNDGQKIEFLDGLYKKYSENPASLNGGGLKDKTSRFIKYLEERRNLDREAHKLINIREGAANSSIKYDKVLDETLSGGTVIAVKGSTLYTAKDLFLFANDVSEILALKTPDVMKDPRKKERISINLVEYLSKFKGTSKEPLANAYIKVYNNSLGIPSKYSPLTSTEQLLYNTAIETQRKYNTVASNLTNKKLNTESEFIAKNMPEYQAQIGTFNMKDDDTKAMVDGFIGNKINKISQYGVADLEKISDLNISTLAEYRKDPQAVYTAVKNYDGSGTLIVSSKGGFQKIPITSTELSRHFPEIARRNIWNEIASDINRSPNKTSNLLNITSGTTGAVSSRFTGYDIPQLQNTELAKTVRVDIEGDKDNIGDTNDVYNVKMYVQPYENGPWISDNLNQTGYVTLGGVKSIFETIGTKTVKDFLKKNK